jgi:hypothetical protein
MTRQHTSRFGALLKTLRAGAGLTQEALAERAGPQDLEGGHSQAPRRDTVELLGDRRILAEVHGARGGALSMQGRVEDSLRAYEQLIPLAEATGDLDTLCSALDSVAHMQLQRGDLAQAWHTLARAITVAEALENEEGVAFETLGSCLIHYYAGDWGQARRDGE